MIRPLQLDRDDIITRPLSDRALTIRMALIASRSDGHVCRRGITRCGGLLPAAECERVQRAFRDRSTALTSDQAALFRLMKVSQPRHWHVLFSANVASWCQDRLSQAGLDIYFPEAMEDAQCIPVYSELRILLSDLFPFEWFTIVDVTRRKFVSLYSHT